MKLGHSPDVEHNEDCTESVLGISDDCSFTLGEDSSAVHLLFHYSNTTDADATENSSMPSQPMSCSLDVMTSKCNAANFLTAKASC